MNIKTTLWKPLAILLMGMMGLSGSLSATNITFSVDMNDYVGSFTTAYVSGSFNGWNDANPLTETAPGSGIWETTVDIPQGNLEYKFMLDNWAADESLTPGSSCTVTTGGFTNRFLIVGPDPVVLETVCYGSCTSCDVVLPTYMVTFQVDMNAYTGPWSSVQINGNFNGWCGLCNPMTETAPGSGVFATTIELDESTIEYKFTVDATSGTEYYETLAEGGSCTLTTDGFTNRVLTVSADETLPVVCFESCEACGGGGVPNDAACDAVEVMVGDTIVADNTGATPDGPFATCWIDAEVEADIWYFFTAPASGIVEIETIDIGGSDDTQVAVYSSSDGTCTGTLTEVGCSDDISGTDYMSFAEVSGLTPGDTYWIQIDGWQGTEGEFELSVQPVTNDEACSAFSVTVDGGPITADNTGATADGPFPDCWVDTAVEADIWYFFTAPSSGSVEIETIDIGANDDTQLGVYSSSDGTCNGSLTEVGCGDDISASNYMTLIEVSSLTPGDTYWIQVDGWQGTDGEFELDVRSTGEVPCPAPDAVICDNFDSYELGDADWITAAHWAPWPGGTVVSNIVDDQAFSNGQSLNVGPGGAEDQLLLLGNQTTGVWTVDFMMYIPAGANGYYNMQNTEATGQWNFDIFFDTGGVGDYQENQASISAFTWPEDTWFQMSHTVDLDNSTVVVELDGVEIHSGAYAGTQVGCINFYSIDGTNNYYLDDVVVDSEGAIDPCPAPDAVVCDNLDTYDLGDADW
ncbi:MAG: hypothetical protein O2867_06960, partial [Bacteroidetes bacterium]|nr:hypothetical protein [Bacteroidota bacterium]